MSQLSQSYTVENFRILRIICTGEFAYTEGECPATHLSVKCIVLSSLYNGRYWISLSRLPMKRAQQSQ